MSVPCARCNGRLEIVRAERTDTRQYGVVEIEHWRCKNGCRGGGHRVLEVGDGGTDETLVHVAGPVLDYAPRVVDDD